MKNISRRKILGSSGVAAVGLATIGTEAVFAQPGSRGTPNADANQNAPQVSYCINTSTIQGQEKSLVEIVKLAAKVGYNGIEPWIREIKSYQKAGGNLKDLNKLIADSGLKVESAIGFANWIVDDDAKRKAGLEQAKVEMDLVAQIGGTRIAAPPAGATNQTDLSLFKAAARYRDLIAVGNSIGVVPQVEVWGFSKSLNRLGECVFVAVESGCKNACVLPDVYHIYKGGSDFAGLGLLAGGTIQCFHMNDYPAEPARDKINDSDRVYPGDGVAPIPEILKSIFANGFSGALSLELFNREYWKQDAELVLRTGLEKMKAAVASAK